MQNAHNFAASARLKRPRVIGILAVVTLFIMSLSAANATSLFAATPAKSVPSNFFSSFESADRAGLLTNTTESGLGASGLSGDFTTETGAPSTGFNITKNTGFTGATALPDSYASNATPDSYQSTYVALNLHFTDGSYLSQLSPVDQHGISLTARGQGAGKILYQKQWNAESADLGVIAKGKVIDRILVTFDDPQGQKSREFSGWIDDVKISASPAVLAANGDPALVDTRRGSNASDKLSHGNTLPIAAMPNGFTFFTPVTDSAAQQFEYSYAGQNNSAGLLTLQGLAISHEPSPWMGDRDQLSIMPSISTDLSADPKTRAVAFGHSDETAQPDLYSVNLQNGIRAKMTPADHGGVFAFTFPQNVPVARVILDSSTNNFSYSLDAKNVLSGWVENAYNTNGATRMYFSGSFSTTPTAFDSASGGNSNARVATFAADANKPTTVELQLATSFISVAQATKNRTLELSGNSFATVQSAATKAWKTRLGVIAVSGASDSQRSTLYSSLYRLNLYPNSQLENTGTALVPAYKYASPVSQTSGSVNGAKIVAGKIYVNNGFWDTYRTVWPAYSSLYPKLTAELEDGFTQLYRDGGWTPRWSSPGYANEMTGTSSDTAFAGAYLRGVALLHPLDTYDAAVKNATVVSQNEATGRKGLTTSIFTKFNNTSQDQSVSWGLESAINDQAISLMGAALAFDPKTPSGRVAQLKEESAYFADQAKSYAKLFNPKAPTAVPGNPYPDSGFFQGRNADGSFPDYFRPTAWGSPYTETNAWGFAFSAPQDGQGLANLYGGRDRLKAKLDEFMSTPESGLDPGSYGGIIHEMSEAAAVRQGQLGISNQPAFHIPYMYDYVGAPARTAEIVRDTLKRNFIGGEIGQGFPGDEDNGATGSWFVLSAMGIYPLQAGSANWVVGSPLFSQMVVKPMDSGRTLTIKAPGNSDRNIYVQSMKINGVSHPSTSLSQTEIKGNATIEFAMGATASAWGTGAADAPPSPTVGSDVPAGTVDITSTGNLSGPSGANLAALIDNNSDTSATIARHSQMVWSGASKLVSSYTITSAKQAGDATDWTLDGSTDGSTWTTLDSRHGQEFGYRQQTRPFLIQTPASYTSYRLNLTGGTADNLSLAEIELLAPVPIQVKVADAWAGQYYSGPFATAANGDPLILRDPLPDGLSLASGGSIVGVPTQQGDYTSAADQLLAGGQVQAYAVSLHINWPTFSRKAPLTLNAGEFLQLSQKKLIMQTDGNLVLYNEQGRAVFVTNTIRNGGGNRVSFQVDCNVVVYDGDIKPIWASNTVRPNNPCSGGLVELADIVRFIYGDKLDRVAWDSNMGGH